MHLQLEGQQYAGELIALQTNVLNYLKVQKIDHHFERCGTVLRYGRKPRRILQDCEERQRPGADGFCHRYLLEGNIYFFPAYLILKFFRPS